MRAAKIFGLIVVGGILGFIIGSKSFNPREPVKDVTSKPVKSAKRKKRTPALNKPRKKKQDVKKAEEK